jgi:hypothetical protein
MSLKIQFLSLSIGASVDQQTGNLSVFEILEEIRAPQLPIHLQSLVISLALEKLETIEFFGKMLIHLFTPDGQQKAVGNGEMKIPLDQKRMKAVFRFAGFPMHQFGRYRFVISCVDQSGAKIAEGLLDFEVLQVNAQGTASISGPQSTLAH